MALFQELNAQGITIVLVTHEPDIARYAKRIVELRDGRIIRDEPVSAPREAQSATCWPGRKTVRSPGAPVMKWRN